VIVVDPLHWWDLPQVLALEQQAFAGTDPWSAEQLWAELAGVPQRRYYLVARSEPDGPVVGYAGLALGPDVADVMTVAVRPTARRRGVGTAMLAELIEQAQRAGVPDVLLEVRADNDAALALYGRIGFSRVGLRRRYYRDGVDGLVLRRRVRRG
jgi:ribosomal-protein-alanine N-acetyltransferase